MHMKSIFLAVTVTLFSFSAIAQVAVNAKKKAEEVVKFKEVKHSFGKIKQGVPVTHNFEFSNISETPVIIENASATCGCTTPVWPQQPIMQTKNDKITAGFNAASPGPFDKTIFVKVKGIDYPLELKITGEVLSAADYAKYESEKKSKKTGS
jgi:Protein of unknown function (DUF1573)